MMLSDSLPRPARPRLIAGLSLRAGDLLAGQYRVTSLVHADRACAHLAASATTGGAAVEAHVMLAMDDAHDGVRLRFLAEARKVAALDVPGVLKVLHVGVTNDGHPFFVREAPNGETLGKLLEQLGSMPTQGAVDVALAIAEVLAAAHTRGLVHGELSTAVVRLAWSLEGPSEVKVVDLATSRALAMLPPDARPIESFAIRAPELLQSGGEPDARADAWGVGVLLYTMLAGAPPFAADTPSTVNLSVALDEPAMLAGVPDGLGDLVEACLARDPALRPQTMEILAARLAPFGSRPVFAKRASLLVVDGERSAPPVQPAPRAHPARQTEIESPALESPPVEARVLEPVPKKEAVARAPSAPSIAARADKTPEPIVVTAPLALTAFPLLPTVTAAEPQRGSRKTAIVAATCITLGLLIGVGAARVASAPSSAPAQAGATHTTGGPAAAPPPRAEAPPPRIETAPAPVSPPVDSTPTLSVTDLRTVPAAPPPPMRAGSLAPKPAPAPAPPPVDPLVHSAAAPLHPVPKASDDDLRRYLDDRR
jgi:eukaryotic-like serine/threonine-protein kinase